jgi:O-antigen biosynthesis protein
MSRVVRPEILAIAKTPPLHDRAGGDHRLFQILRMLAGANNVDFLSTWHAVLHKQKERPVSYVVRDGTFSKRNMKFLDGDYFEDLRSIGVHPLNQPEPLPFIIRPTNDYDIRPFLQKKQYDIIWIEYFYLADQYLDQIRQLQPWAHVIVDSMELHYLRMERQCKYLETKVHYSVDADQRRSPLADDFEKNIRDHRNYAAHVKEHELRTYAKCDRIVVSSHCDEKELKAQLPRSETLFVPHPRGSIPSKKVASSWKKRSGLVFMGNFDHGPNSSAAIFLKHEIAPALEARMHSAPIYIVGNNPPYLIRNMERLGPCANQFHVTGHVPNTRKYLDKARVSVAPILFGAGMNSKIGEALSNGLPVVTTSLGAQSLQLEHEVNCLIAETPSEFATQIQRVYEDEQLWMRLSQNGLKLIENSFNLVKIESSLQEQLFRSINLSEIRIKQKVAKQKSPRLSKPQLLAPTRFKYCRSPDVSVIVLSFNQWDYTELCLQSLSHAQAQYPDLDVEHILVDNGSTDGTVSKAQAIPGLKVIANAKNLGFAAGNNIGIQAARGKNIVLLNNDTIVSPSWLKRLHCHAQKIGKVGIIGPSTNTEPGQALYGVRYNGLSEFFSLNNSIGKSNAGQWELAEKISGLCMYIPRPVIDRVGLLSEEYGIGYFEDDDYCFRVHDAGFRTIWAKDVYVHHFGSVSFENSKSLSREKHLQNGMSQFIFKWGNRALKHVAKSHRQTLIKSGEFPLHS